MILINITDHTGQVYITEVDEAVPANAAQLSATRTPEDALHEIRNAIQKAVPLHCEIVHSNNRAKVLMIFVGPFTLGIFAPREHTELV